FIFSISRMGLLAPVVMLLLFCSLWMVDAVAGRRRLILTVGCAVLVLLLAGAWPALETVAERFQRTDTDYRPAAWQATYAMFQASPVMGFGLGALVDNLPRFLAVPIEKTFDHAHN